MLHAKKMLCDHFAMQFASDIMETSSALNMVPGLIRLFVKLYHFSFGFCRTINGPHSFPGTYVRAWLLTNSGGMSSEQRNRQENRDSQKCCCKIYHGCSEGLFEITTRK